MILHQRTCQIIHSDAPSRRLESLAIRLIVEYLFKLTTKKTWKPRTIGPLRGKPFYVMMSKYIITQGFTHVSICADIKSLKPEQNGRCSPDDILKLIFLIENVYISNNISFKFVPTVPMNNIPVLFQIMAWRRPGDKPFSEPMMVSLLTHIYATRPQWFNGAI